MSIWWPYFVKELEKRAWIGTAINVAMGASAVSDKAKENKKLMQLDSTRHIENQLQLPAAASENFNGGKRIDDQSITAVNKF